MGMIGRLAELWREQNTKYLINQRRAGDVVGGFGSLVSCLADGLAVGSAGGRGVLGDQSRGHRWHHDCWLNPKRARLGARRYGHRQLAQLCRSPPRLADD